MARTSCATFLRSRIAAVALPLICAAFASLAACDKNNGQQPQRRYCDATSCYACDSDGRCQQVPGDPIKPDPGMTTSCDNDAACGADRLCNLGRCEPSCKDDAACASGLACISGRCRPSDSAKCGTAGARCTDDTQCGATQKCISRVCASPCVANACPHGQVCQAGSCIEDPSPASAECVFDTDCAAAGKASSRCVNAYCLATCSDNASCGTDGASCLKGLCRGSR